MMTRRLSIAIDHATETTCGNTRTGCCDHVRVASFSGGFSCHLFEKRLQHAEHDDSSFTPQRLPECIEAEVGER